MSENHIGPGVSKKFKANTNSNYRLPVAENPYAKIFWNKQGYYWTKAYEYYKRF